MTLEKLFRPASIAVIGVSNDEKAIGAELVRNLLRGPFQGPVYPVNPKRDWVLGIKAWKSVEDIPGPVDLAIVSVPKRLVLAAVESCGRKGVKAAIILTAGFKEVGGEGVALEQRLFELVRKYGMRAIGPNCMGMIVTDPAVRMNASFGAAPPMPGNIALVSQSGALGEGILALAHWLGLGFSAFVSLGNRVDVSVNDLLEHWTEDEGTGVILMYLESFGNMAKFPAIAARAARKKPVIVVKSGRTVEGARAASSHTGSLAGGDLAADAVFEKTGMLRAATIEELFSLAAAFSNQPLPKGNRIAIVTNAGGPGILVTDVLISGGMKLAVLSEETKAACRAVLPAEASLNNPLDMIATSAGPQYEACVAAVMRDPGVDAMVVIFVSPITIDAYSVAQALVAGLHAAARPEKPVLVCFMGNVAHEEGTRLLKANRLPTYMFPEQPARALIAMDRLRRFHERPAGTIPAFAVERDKAHAVLAQVAARAQSAWLEADELAALLACYGLPTLAQRSAASAGEAAVAAAELGLPVAMKIDSPDIVHKSEVKGVLLNLRTQAEVQSGFDELRQRAETLTRNYRIILQPMAGDGLEMIAGFSTEPNFGKLIVAGLGGIYVEVMRDIALRLGPLTDVEVAEMIDSLRSAQLLRGYRGAPAGDIAAFKELLLRLSQLAAELPELETLEMNPVLVRKAGQGAVILDARAKLL